MKFGVGVTYKYCHARVIFMTIGSIDNPTLLKDLSTFIPILSTSLDQFAWNLVEDICYEMLMIICEIGAMKIMLLL
jgi:hypothetical protein